jgi:hypothetical protein
MTKEVAIELGKALLIALFLIGGMLGMIALARKRSMTILKAWAENNGYEILQCKRPFRSGGFSYITLSRGQVVYSVKVRDKKGRERSGWVKCGSYVGGVLSSDNAEVKWSD